MGCHAHTIRLGLQELSDDQGMNARRIRRPGSGRKKALEQIQGLDEPFLRVVAAHTAGSPMDESLKTGLQVFTNVISGVYQTGKKVAEDFKQNIKIVFDEVLPQWNYTAKPQPGKL